MKRRSGWHRGEGLRGGNPEAEGQGSSDQSSCVGKRAEEGEQTSRSAVNSEETQSSDTVCGSDDDQMGLDYGSAESDLEEILDMELLEAECETGEMGKTKERAGEEEQMSEEASNTTGTASIFQRTIVTEEENCGKKFLKEIDNDFLCAPRKIVRGEYVGIARNGGEYKLIVRRKAGEGTYVTYDICDVKSGRNVFRVHGEMNYPYEMSRTAASSRNIGAYVVGGWSWRGWGYGTVNVRQISDIFPSDQRDLHVDMWEAVFWDKEVHFKYHVSGPTCQNWDKAEGVNCTEVDCGLRVWSNEF